MDSESYRRLQLDAVTGHNGTSEMEIILVTSWLVFGTLFYNTIPARCFKGQGLVRLSIEFMVLVVPQVILFLYPQSSLPIMGTALTIGILTLLPQLWKVRPASTQDRRPFLTNSRAAIMIMVTLGILAVDFTPFPRRFVKTQTLGISLMDVGVGCVIVSMGIIAARLYRAGADRPGIWTVIRSSVPLFLMGVVRMMVVELMDYQKAVGEYGVHWNFFITLGLIPIALYSIYSLIPPQYSFVSGIFLGAIYQVVLNSTGLQAYLFGDLRLSLLDQNKEGVYSLIGYVSLALMSVGVGLDLFPFQGPRRVLARWLPKFILVTLLYAIFKFHVGIQSSRRIANFPFGLASLALTIFQMFGFLGLEWYFADRPSPLIFSAVSFNQLSFFLFVQRKQPEELSHFSRVIY